MEQIDNSIESTSDSEYIESGSDTLTDVMYDDVSSIKEFNTEQEHEYRMTRERTKQIVHTKEKHMEVTKQKQHEIDILKLRLQIKVYTVKELETEIELLRLCVQTESDRNLPSSSTKRKIEHVSV